MRNGGEKGRGRERDGRKKTMLHAGKKAHTDRNKERERKKRRNVKVKNEHTFKAAADKPHCNVQPESV